MHELLRRRFGVLLDRLSLVACLTLLEQVLQQQPNEQAVPDAGCVQHALGHREPHNLEDAGSC